MLNLLSREFCYFKHIFVLLFYRICDFFVRLCKSCYNLCCSADVMYNHMLNFNLISFVL